MGKTLTYLDANANYQASNISGIVSRSKALFENTALTNKTTLYDRDFSGFLKDSNLDLVKEFGIDVDSLMIYDNKDYKCYCSDTFVFSYSKQSSGLIDGGFSTTSKDLVDLFDGKIDELINETRPNAVYAIVQTSQGFDFSYLGVIDNPLIRENYDDEIIKSYDYVMEQFSQSPPFGRLVVINGPPGTGKTYFVRGLINSLENHSIVLLPANLISSLDGPSLLPLLINHKHDHDESLLLIIEDADECLLPRDGSNMSNISAMLNHTDGIVGDLLDLKIIATTNAKHIDIDNALLRPGRLLKHINISNLNGDKCLEIYRRLIGDPNAALDVSGEMSLAEVYMKAGILNNKIVSNSGDKKALTKKSRIGFRYKDKPDY